MSDRVIFHIDVNSAYLSWEAAERLKADPQALDIRTIPCAVGGDIEQRRGVILAKSLSAKKYGVRTGESIMEARRKCPNLQLVGANHRLYAAYSRNFMNILREYTPDVEKFSIDEMFMDMTGTRKLWGEPLTIAWAIKDRIRDELGFTVNVGISSNKLLAKMASDFEKPDKVHTLFPCEIQRKMWPLPVGQLFLVGKATTDKLNKMGIFTIGELAQTRPEALERHLKKHGRIIWEYANGIDDSPVANLPPENKGYGNSTTLPHDVTDSQEAKRVLLSLAESVAKRLRNDNMRAEVVSVGIKDFRLHYASHQRVLENPTNVTAKIHHVACQLFDELWDGTPIRLLGIQTTRLTKGEAVRQLNLFEDEEEYEKNEKLDAVMDAIRSKFGDGAVTRASFLEGSFPKKVK